MHYILSAFLLLLAACVHVPEKVNPTKLTAVDFAPLNPQPVSSATPWTRYFYDIQVISEDGKLLKQTNRDYYNQYTHSKLSDTRMLRRATSFGSSENAKDGKTFGVQSSTGLWLHEPTGKERARIYIDYSWPQELGREPQDLSKTTITRARIECEQWAIALAAAESKKIRYDMLKTGLESRYSDKHNLKAELVQEPYRIGDHVIVPVVVTLRKADFASQCMQ